MPRQSRGRPSPSRHSAPASAPSRSASTQNVPATQSPPPHAAAQQSAGPGMFGNMMSTAAGVGIGSAIGHSIGGFFTGGSSQPAPEPAAQQNAPTAYDSYGAQAAQENNSYATGISCEGAAKDFTKCLEATNSDMNSCSYYLDALKQCQAMARGV